MRDGPATGAILAGGLTKRKIERNTGVAYLQRQDLPQNRLATGIGRWADQERDREEHMRRYKRRQDLPRDGPATGAIFAGPVGWPRTSRPRCIRFSCFTRALSLHDILS